MEKIVAARFMLHSVSVYRDVTEDPVVAALKALLDDSLPVADDAARLYSELYSGLAACPYGPNLADYLFGLVLGCDNYFSRQCASNNYIGVPLSVKEAVERELTALSMVATLESAEVKAFLKGRFPGYENLFDLLPDWKTKNAKFSVSPSWGSDICKLGELYKTKGCGVYAGYRAFWVQQQSGSPVLFPMPWISQPTVRQLPTPAQTALFDHVSTFVQGNRADSLLLCGRGSASLVAAALGSFAGQGLRVAEMDGADLTLLPQVIQLLGGTPMRFILLISEPPLERTQPGYNRLQAALGQSVGCLPENVALCATTLQSLPDLLPQDSLVHLFDVVL